jgi:hypothetical protein
MEFEIWSSESGNRIFASGDLNETLAWALDYWLQEGDRALDALSVGDELDRWVVRGPRLRQLLRDRLWRAPVQLRTSANDHLEDWTKERPSHLVSTGAN